MKGSGAIMQALLLAGGLGTRLRPLTERLPKPMVPVFNVAWLEHLVRWLKDAGITEIVLALGYRGDKIREHCGDGSQWGVRIRYVQEETPLGTGGAMRLAAPLLHETTFVLNADVISQIDIDRMFAQHRSSGAKVSIALTYVDDPTAYGVVETTRDGRVIAFTEKPSKDQVRSHWINAGAYLFEPEYLAAIPAGRPVSVEKEFFPQLLKDRIHILGVPYRGYWKDIGTPEKYLEAHFDAMRGKWVLPLVGALHRKSIVLGQGVKIDSKAVLRPPVFIGDHVIIEAGAVVGPMVVIGRGTHIQREATVAHSVLWESVTVEAGAVVGGAIIGTGACVTDGQGLYNRAFTGNEVEVVPA